MIYTLTHIATCRGKAHRAGVIARRPASPPIWHLRITSQRSSDINQWHNPFIIPLVKTYVCIYVSMCMRMHVHVCKYKLCVCLPELEEDTRALPSADMNATPSFTLWNVSICKCWHFAINCSSSFMSLWSCEFRAEFLLRRRYTLAPQERFTSMTSTSLQA